MAVVAVVLSVVVWKMEMLAVLVGVEVMQQQVVVELQE
jgi:hypothetical protein